MLLYYHFPIEQEEGFEYASAALKEKEAVFNEEKESLQVCEISAALYMMYQVFL